MASERRLGHAYDELDWPGVGRKIRNEKAIGAGGQSTDPTSQARETNPAPGDSQPNIAVEHGGMKIDIKPGGGAMTGTQEVIFDTTQQ